MTTTTRRNILRLGTAAAAYTAGAAIVTGGVAFAARAKGAEIAPANRVAWDRAYAAMTAAGAADDAVNARYEVANAAGRDALEAEYERLGEARYQATWALFDIPAPDHAALLWKSEYLFGDKVPDDAGSASWAGHVINVYMADAPPPARWGGPLTCPTTNIRRSSRSGSTWRSSQRC